VPSAIIDKPFPTLTTPVVVVVAIDPALADKTPDVIVKPLPTITPPLID
jgi:hypothetical protein